MRNFVTNIWVGYDCSLGGVKFALGGVGMLLGRGISEFGRGTSENVVPWAGYTRIHVFFSFVGRCN